MSGSSRDESSMVIGFTEAELGLALAAVFLVLWLAGGLAPDSMASPRPDELAVSEDSARILLGRIDSLEAIAATTEGLRSRLAPPCPQVGVIDGPVADVVVVASDSVLAWGFVQSIREFRSGVSGNLREGTRQGCRHTLNVRLRPGIDAVAYDRAVRRLREDFYVLFRGSSSGSL